MAFPHGQYTPTLFSQNLHVPFITFHVSIKLQIPILPVRSWSFGSFTVMLVPVTAMDKDDLIAAGKNQIWFSWKIFSVQSISESQAMNQPPYSDFKIRINSMHVPHYCATLCRVENVGHDLQPVLLALFFRVTTSRMKGKYRKMDEEPCPGIHLAGLYDGRVRACTCYSGMYRLMAVGQKGLPRLPELPKLK